MDQRAGGGPGRKRPFACTQNLEESDDMEAPSGGGQGDGRGPKSMRSGSLGGRGPATFSDVPDELVAWMLNGRDSKGRPLLDRRLRFVCRHVCRQWHAHVDDPSHLDAAHIRADSPPRYYLDRDDADGSVPWTKGRLACVSAIADAVRAAADEAGEAPIPFGRCVAPWAACMEGRADADRGAVIAAMVGGSDEFVVDRFWRWVADATRRGDLDWYAAFDASHARRFTNNATDPPPPTERCRTPARETHRALMSARGASDLLRTACRVGRVELVDRLIESFNVRDPLATLPCVVDAAAANLPDVVYLILYHLAVALSFDHAGADREGVCTDSRLVGHIIAALEAAGEYGSVDVIVRVYVQHMREGAPLCVRWDERTIKALIRASYNVVARERHFCVRAAARGHLGVFRPLDAPGSALAHLIDRSLASAAVCGRMEVLDFLRGAYRKCTGSLVRDIVTPLLAEVVLAATKYRVPWSQRSLESGLDWIVHHADGARPSAKLFDDIGPQKLAQRPYRQVAAAIMGRWPSVFAGSDSWKSVVRGAKQDSDSDTLQRLLACQGVPLESI
jgi:hypothetical protein